METKKASPMTKEEKRAIQAEKDRKMDELLYNNFTSAEGKKRRKKNIRIGFAITLVVMLLISFVNWGVISGWGNVRIDRLTIVGSDGAEFSALIYVPVTATDDNPAPAIICYHGNAGNARNHESWAVEFSRRGFVVLSIDQFGAGDSQGFFPEIGDQPSPTRTKVLEAEQWYQYLLSMPIVDNENIISAGHSMGCAAATSLGAMYGAKLILGASPAAMLKAKDESVYAQTWMKYTGNYVTLTGLVETTEEEEIEAGLELLQKRDPAATEFELGKLYGSFEENNAYLAILEPNRIHEAAFVSTQTIGNLLKYGQMAIGDAVPNPIDHTNQVWMYKDYIGLAGIFSFAAFVCALALLLIEEIPVFTIVKRPLARNIGLRKQGFALSAVLSIVFPYIVLKTDAFGLIGGRYYNNLRALGFNLGFTNMAFGTLIGLNLLGLLGFALFYFTDGKKVKMNLNDLGLTPGDSNRISLKMVGATVLLSAIVIGISWSVILFLEEIFGTDFYAWFFGVKNISFNKIPHYWNYLIVWIACFVVASFTINVERRLPTTGNETLDTILQIVVNVLLATAVIVIVVAVKWYLQTIGSAADKNAIWKMGVDTQRLWGMPVGMAVGIGGSTFMYRKTGNTWLSAFLMGTVACLLAMTFGSTRFHF